MHSNHARGAELLTQRKPGGPREVSAFGVIVLKQAASIEQARPELPGATPGWSAQPQVFGPQRHPSFSRWNRIVVISCCPRISQHPVGAASGLLGRRLGLVHQIEDLRPPGMTAQSHAKAIEPMALQTIGLRNRKGGAEMRWERWPPTSSGSLCRRSPQVIRPQAECSAIVQALR